MRVAGWAGAPRRPPTAFSTVSAEVQRALEGAARPRRWTRTAAICRAPGVRRPGSRTAATGRSASMVLTRSAADGPWPAPMRMSSGPSRMKEKPRSASSSCIDETPRSKTTPSQRSTPASPGPPPARRSGRCARRKRPGKACRPGARRSARPTGRGRRRSPTAPRFQKGADIAAGAEGGVDQLAAGGGAQWPRPPRPAARRGAGASLMPRRPGRRWAVRRSARPSRATWRCCVPMGLEGVARTRSGSGRRGRPPRPSRSGRTCSHRASGRVTRPAVSKAMLVMPPSTTVSSEERSGSPNQWQRRTERPELAPHIDDVVGVTGIQGRASAPCRARCAGLRRWMLVVDEGKKSGTFLVSSTTTLLTCDPVMRMPLSVAAEPVPGWERSKGSG